MSGRWFRILVLASVGFLFIYLIRIDRVPAVGVESPVALVLSIVFLIAGYLIQSLAWWATVRAAGFEADPVYCVAGSGLAVFTQYIPGKVLIVMGRAMYLAERLGFPVSTLSMTSLTAQLISLWTGVTLGAGGVIVWGGLGAWSWAVFVVWLLLTIAVFSDFVHVVVEQFARRILKKEWTAPRLRLRATLAVIPWFAALWSSWGLGFYFFTEAILGPGTPVGAGFALPLATAVGIAAVFAPGGLGVREAALTGILVSIGLATTDATAASIYSRFWFLGGELTMFMIGVAANRIVTRNSPQTTSD